MITFFEFQSKCYEGTCDICGKERVPVIADHSMLTCLMPNKCFECSQTKAEPIVVLASFLSHSNRYPDCLNEDEQTAIRDTLVRGNVSQKTLDTLINYMSDSGEA